MINMSKRKNRGRSKGTSAGSETTVQCVKCNAQVPKDKAIKNISHGSSVLTGRIAHKMRKEEGAYVPYGRQVKYYCVSCAIEIGLISQREKSKRKGTNSSREASDEVKELLES